MDQGASSNAAAFVGAGEEEKQLKAMYETEAKKVARLQALLSFGRAAHAEAMRYSDMEEEEVVEEYRRAGKLHTYDVDKEWKKRFARVAKLHPCPWGKQTAAKVAEYTYYLEEDEDDFRIGLYSLIRE
ncbi:hypothetical protein CFC21_046506 [Triticum aestivum]|uniref:Uncharacterized protein n=3 Tax=Triticinae TaxID=1648030 RepID=A0A453ECN8_AEGTS|nr:hypothetical protein CFC21_046506 [Triticum aestivum]